MIYYYMKDLKAGVCFKVFFRKEVTERVYANIKFKFIIKLDYTE